MSKPAAKKPADNTVGTATNQSSGQNVGLLRMLKKYGTGWQTRIVRAQRS